MLITVRNEGIKLKKKISLLIAFMAFAICSLFAVNAFADETAIIDNSSYTLGINTTAYTYDGLEKKPAVSLTFTDENGDVTVLRKDIDYKVSYTNNVNAGTATVTACGTGNYSGTISRNFTINPVNIKNNGNVDLTLGYTSTVYSGNAKTPTPYLYFTNSSGKVLLTKNTDYTVKFVNNVNMGKATVYIYGTKNFTGTISKNFKILPKQVTSLKSKVNGTATTNSITLSWKKQSGVSGYQIYKYDDSSKTYKYLIRISPSDTSYTVKNLNPATRYYFKVRAYKTVSSGVYYYGSFSDYTTNVTIPNRVTLNSVYKSGANSIKVSWNKVRCTGYEIYYSSDPTFKTDNHCKKITGASTTSYTIKGISKYRTYYVRVRAYCTSRNVQYSGYMSYYLSTKYAYRYATYSSSYVNNANRTNNLIIASRAISGTVVMPGETFSFNDVVGPRTAAKGYKKAPVFVGSTSVENEVGGGICQVASTMFNCALNANVGIVERHQHSQRVSYVPLGRDAAIYSTSEDFKWKNTTSYPIEIYMSVSGGKITCSFYTATNVKPKSVSIKVSQSGKSFTLRRYVGKNVNYSCSSYY